MPAQKRKKRFVKKHFQKNPFCPQCGVLMILPEMVEGYPKVNHYPKNLAVYEHTNTRVNPLRGEPTLNRIVCWKCNQENNKKNEERFLSLDDLHKRAKNDKFYPREFDLKKYI